MIVFSARHQGLTSRLALLAIDPEIGRLRRSIGFGIAAAALLDLSLRGRIAIAGPTVSVIDERPTGDPVLDEALRRIIEEREQTSAAHWIRSLGRTRDLRERVIRGLEDGGLIRRLDERIAAVFPAERYVVVPVRLREYLVARVRATLLIAPTEAGRDDVALAVLLASVGLLERFFGRDERELAAIRAASLMRGDRVRSALAGALSEVQVLATAAAIESGAVARAS